MYVLIFFPIFYRGTPVVKLQNMKDVTEDVGLGRNGTRVKIQCPKGPNKKPKGKNIKKR